MHAASFLIRLALLGGIFLHWLFSVVLIVGPRTSDAYPFITNLGTYTQSVVKSEYLTWEITFDSSPRKLHDPLTCATALIGSGLVYLALSPRSGWKTERTSFHTSPLLTILWVFSLLFVLIAPFVPNNRVTPTIPWFVVPTVGCSVVAIGTLYWFYWFKLWPMLGWAVETDKEVLPDGSERVKYSVGLSRLPHT